MYKHCYNPFMVMCTSRIRTLQTKQAGRVFCLQHRLAGRPRTDKVKIWKPSWGMIPRVIQMIVVLVHFNKDCVKYVDEAQTKPVLAPVEKIRMKVF